MGFPEMYEPVEKKTYHRNVHKFGAHLSHTVCWCVMLWMVLGAGSEGQLFGAQFEVIPGQSIRSDHVLSGADFNTDAPGTVFTGLLTPGEKAVFPFHIPHAAFQGAEHRIPFLAVQTESGGNSDNKKETDTVVRVLFTNNSNGKLVSCNCPNDPFGGLAERVALIRTYREKNGDSFLLLDSGGFWGLSNIERNGPLVLKLMDIMGYAAWGVGDQELYNGLATFLKLSEPWRKKIITASISSAEGDSLFVPYRVVTLNGIRLGITGIASPGETFRYFPEERKDFSVEEPDVALGRVMTVLERSSDYIIVLSQMGADVDREIAARWPGIDLIIGGHSQTLIEQPVTVSQCRIVQAGRNAGRVGEIVLVFDVAKNVIDFSYHLMEVNDTYMIPVDILEFLNEN